MSNKAPTRLDRAVLRFVSGSVGHLVGTVLEVVALTREHRRARREERRGG